LLGYNVRKAEIDCCITMVARIVVEVDCKIDIEMGVEVANTPYGKRQNVRDGLSRHVSTIYGHRTLKWNLRVLK
jgi:hypothetical protein